MEHSTNTLLAGLLTASATRDPQAFAELYRLTSGRLNAVSYRLMGDREAAKEVLQEAYVRIWQQAHRFDQSAGTALGWMTTIARNTAIDALRSRRNQVVPIDGAESIAERDGLYATISLSIETETAIRHCVERLPNPEGSAVVFSFYYGLTHVELAERLGAPLGTVKSWVRRGLTRLKKCLETQHE